MNEADNQRAKLCFEAVEAILKAHNCVFDVEMILKPNQHPQIKVIVLALTPQEDKKGDANDSSPAGA